MDNRNVERNLLFRILALQNNLIDQVDLIAAFHAWSVDKTRRLGDVLVERGAIGEEERSVVDLLIVKHLKRYGDDVRTTLALLAGGEARPALRAVEDTDIRQSLSALPPVGGEGSYETLLPVSVRRSRYRLSRVHGEGSLGRVWVAHDTDLNRDVALKEIQPERSGQAEAARRFLRDG